MFVGEIPKGLQVDHKCDNTVCVNFMHLQVLTSRANSARSTRGASSVNSAKTHCDYGHPFDEENTTWTKRGESLHRSCRTCNQRRWQEDYAKRKAGVESGRLEDHCRNGHPYTRGNTRITPAGSRVCRTCVNAAAIRRRERLKAEGRAPVHPRKRGEAGVGS
jgi:hypothetical protein